jgi:aryl-alcohol dehydrogenase-like predicted oxidoreductase
VPGHQGGESETVIRRWLKRRGRRDDDQTAPDEYLGALDTLVAQGKGAI